MTRKALFLGIFALCASAGVNAAQPVGPYGGVLAGSADLTIDVTEDESYSTDKFTWGAQLGWQFNQNFALEASYLRPKAIRQSGTIDTDTVTISGKLYGLTASAIASFPLGDVWSVHARVGAVREHEKYSIGVNGTNLGSASQSSTDVIYGAGIGAIVEGARMRLEYQRAKFDAGKVGLISLSLSWFFAKP